MTERYDPALLQQLCEQASKEMDPDKLLRLTKRINQLLESREQAAKNEQSKKKSA